MCALAAHAVPRRDLLVVSKYYYYSDLVHGVFLRPFLSPLQNLRSRARPAAIIAGPWVRTGSARGTFDRQPRVRVAMSETLPPICREGVVLRFVFPFDTSLSRTASLFWRSTHPKVDTWYADLTQGGDTSIVHEQVTFPGDAWVVYVKGRPDRVLAYHVATGEREQQVLITGEAAARVEQPHSPAALTAAASSALTSAEQEDEELAEATRLNLAPKPAETSEAAGAGGGGGASAPAVEAEGDALLSGAMALSRELAAAHRAVEAAHRDWLVLTSEGVAGPAGGGGGEARVRLQLTLPDGTRSTHNARHDTPLRSAPRRLKASPDLGLLCGRAPWACLGQG